MTKNLMFSAIVAVVVSIVSVAVGLRYFVKQPRPMAVVDVAEVLRAKEQQFMEVVTKAGASEVERKEALAGAGEFAKKLPGALEGLTSACDGCIVLLNTAVAAKSEDVVDLTPLLRQEMGIGPK